MIPQEIFTQYSGLGLSCIPCEQKRPNLAWKEFQARIPSPEELTGFKGAQIALICGKVSGGLVCIDFDVKNGDRFEEWQTIVSNTCPELLSKMAIENTPSGGYHVIFRTNKKIGNLKLAMNSTGKECTIETRGEGGYFVCAPSPDYSWYYNTIENIEKITNEETDLLLCAAKSLCEKPVEEHVQQIKPSFSSTGLSPFDDYDNKCDIVSLLGSHGWKTAFVRNDTTFLTRPGKDDRSISATWNRVPNRLYCFTTSTVFDNQKVYKASAVYAILEHGGDYSAAAKKLYADGFGDRITPETIPEKKQELKIINTSRMTEKLIDIKNNGYPKGGTTGWKTLDKMFTIAKKQFTVIHGVPSAGKSEFMDALAINLMMHSGWKFAVFSPENYPAEMHYHKLTEKILNSRIQDNTDEDIDIAVRTINEHFYFIDALEDDLDLDQIFFQALELIKTKNVDALIIDPWNEIELLRPNNVSESDFIGNCLRKSRKFARKNNIHLFILAHPTKLSKNKDGVYPIPELYDISGSAHWRNKADNGICIHRDYEKKCTTILVQKVKFKYFGCQGECDLYYEEKSGRYNEDQSDEAFIESWSNK